MRVLHLFSNCKWTGPAEPALNLCVALRARGIEADFACAPDAGASINKVVETARDRGIEPLLRFHLTKHRHPLHNFQDRLALARFLKEERYDLIHCHMDNDHAIAIGPAARQGIPVVRSSYEGLGLAKSLRRQRLLRGTALLIEASNAALEHDRRVYAFPGERAMVVPGAVDTARFDPARELPDGRRWLNVPHDAFVAGIVARMQTHRHYEDLLKAFRRLVDAAPNVYLIAVGRGTKQEQVAMKPVRDLGLEKQVLFPGFIDGENYTGMLQAFDAGVFLVPGSDGTCRAAREIMAMGKPMIVADRGMLPEIVTHEQDGLVCDGSVDGLYRALRTLQEDRSRRRQMGQAARATALARYSLHAQSAAVLEGYQRLLEQPL